MNCSEALKYPRPESPDLPIVLVAAAALIDASGRVLLAQRPQGKSMANLWEFPGGKVEAGEPPEYALMRELVKNSGLKRGHAVIIRLRLLRILMRIFIC